MSETERRGTNEGQRGETSDTLGQRARGLRRGVDDGRRVMRPRKGAGGLEINHSRKQKVVVVYATYERTGVDGELEVRCRACRRGSIEVRRSGGLEVGGIMTGRYGDMKRWRRAVGVGPRRKRSIELWRSGGALPSCGDRALKL